MLNEKEITKQAKKIMDDFIKVLDLLKTIYPLENKAVDTMPV